MGQFNVRSIGQVTSLEKTDVRLSEGGFPDWAYSDGKVKIMITCFPHVGEEVYKTLLQEANIDWAEGKFHYPLVMTEIPVEQIATVAALPFVHYLEMGPSPDIPEDTGGRSLQRSNMLNTDYIGGKKYDAEGVRIMVRDDGKVGPHIDFEGRIVDFTGSDTGTHGDGVAGVFGGAGNLDPTVEGGAAAAEIYVLNYNSTFTDATEPLHQSDNVVITNSSYSNGCNAGYTSTTQRVDQQMVDNPSFLHVFSAGNSNNNDCGYGAGNQWGNITGGHKVGKNVMATANLFASEGLSTSSSRGPAHDGRIKPDIAAHGQGQRSTNPNNAYQSFGGTSAAAPSMASNLAQLYHAYRDMNAGADPDAALIKASALNSAHDLGNRGPDFKYGWGRIHTLRAYEILANQNWVTDNLSQSNSNSHTIQIPAGVAAVRVMAYWKDPAASVSAAPALVNDLDLTLEDPSSTTHYPWLLNTTPDPDSLDKPAINGVDTLNNMEQVELGNPVAGTYTAHINGTTVPMGPQQYYLVWIFLYDGVTVTYPLGGEGFVQGETERIHWDAWGTTGTFDIAYSTDDGGSWNNIATGLSGNTRQYTWNAFGVAATDEALIRVTNRAFSDVPDTTFTIMPLPANINVNAICIYGATVSWNAVTGADEFAIYKLGATQMEVIGVTDSTAFDYYGLTPGETYWFSVEARTTAGGKGRRADAVSYTHVGTGICPVDDLALDSLIAPMDIGFDCSVGNYTNSETVTVRIVNSGNSDLSGFPVSYQKDSGLVVSETFAGTILSGDTATYTFAATVDLSAGDAFSITVLVGDPLDAIPSNDTLTISFKATNIPLELPVMEGFETAVAATYNQNGVVLDGAPWVGFETSLPGIGRLRTSAGAGFIKEGDRALTLDVSDDSNLATNYAIVTFNLSDYVAATNLLLDFSFTHHGDESSAEDRVWIRGSDTDAWIEIYDWYANRPAAGVYKDVVGIPVSQVLSNAGQMPSCSFQVRFGQQDNFSASSPTQFDGLSVDNIWIRECDHLYVDENATGANNGSSWVNAYTDLQSALDNMDACDGNVIEIWVASGTYFPSKDTTGSSTPAFGRDVTFFIDRDVRMYGGFAGTETSIAERDTGTAPTILSGDIGTPVDSLDNAYTVLFTKNLSTASIFNGLTIQEGQADVGSSGARNKGGGWYNDGTGSGNESSPAIEYCVFQNNYAIYGGGISNNGTGSGNCQPTFSHCTFSANVAMSDGGGSYNWGENGNSSPSYLNCLFLGNDAGTDGGAVANLGNTSAPSFTNCTFSGNNTVGTGAVLYNFSAQPSLLNCILWGNSSTVNDDGGSTTSASDCVIEGGFAGGTSIQITDPLFVSQPDFNNAPTTVGDVHFQVGSSALDNGDNAHLPVGLDFDFDGYHRIANGTVDIGIYETVDCHSSQTRTWSGATNNDWLEATNWECGLPDATLGVIIPDGTPDAIICVGQLGECLHLTVEQGAELIVEIGGILDVVEE